MATVPPPDSFPETPPMNPGGGDEFDMPVPDTDFPDPGTPEPNPAQTG